jgi:hypothetical protein
MSMNLYYKKKRKDIMRFLFRKSSSNPANTESAPPEPSDPRLETTPQTPSDLRLESAPSTSSDSRVESPKPSTSAASDQPTSNGASTDKPPKKRSNFSIDALMADAEVPKKKASMSAEHSRSSSMQPMRHLLEETRPSTEKRNASQPPNSRVSLL